MNSINDKLINDKKIILKIQKHIRLYVIRKNVTKDNIFLKISKITSNKLEK